MSRKLILILLFAVVVTLPRTAKSQEPQRKVSIEITTNENGETTTRKIDLEKATNAELQEALQELGIMDHFSFSGDDENVVIDIRRSGPGDEGEQTFHYRTMPPMAQGEKHTWLGVRYRKMTEELIQTRKLPVKEGVEILEVLKDSPAQAAGLTPGDVITHVDGSTVSDPGSLSAMIRSHKAGDKVKVTYHRDGKKQQVAVTLGEREEQREHAYFGHGKDHPHHSSRWYRHHGPRAYLGVTLDEASIGDTGAAVGSVEEGSAAEVMGLRKNDLIRTINGQPVRDAHDLSRRIRSMRPGDPIVLGIQRDGVLQEVRGELGEKPGMPDMEIPFPQLDSMNFNFKELHELEGFQFKLEGVSEEDREKLRKEMDVLRREMDKLRQELSGGWHSETRIKIEGRELTDTEKAMLKEKGVSGLENELQIEDLSIFPNPSNGFFRIQFDVPERGDLEVDVHDTAGERIYQERITAYQGRYERTLDLNDKTSGTYYLVLRQNGKATTRKLVKQ